MRAYTIGGYRLGSMLTDAKNRALAVAKQNSQSLDLVQATMMGDPGYYAPASSADWSENGRPAWMIPAIVGGVALLGLGAFVVLKRKKR